ncbi:DUF397 domain-containing protein [Streptomyces genisteinicus]|uniref:DUF397 domain-containing protein n=1 Tax=Streptomyces genisteinicus TaxID=2768068 RepID=A0A7H0I050_9ACTN|nr:DUF397 domain-containing protein [Streptomyces genisteinicus]QNP66166.1 DUF397 domain-containing protein [Streptomyces genisteinicus]
MNVVKSVPATPALVWVKSSYSSGEGGQCVEVATRCGSVHVRDSKDVTVSPLTVRTGAWRVFVGFAGTGGTA